MGKLLTNDEKKVFIFTILALKRYFLLELAPKEEIPKINAHIFKFFNLLLPFPSDLYKIEIKVYPGQKIQIDAEELLEKEGAKVFFPQCAEINLIRFQNEFAEIIKKVPPNQGKRFINFLKLYFKTIWEKTTLDYYPLLFKFVELGQTDKLQKILSRYNEGYLEAIKLGKIYAYNPLGDADLIGLLEKCKEMRGKILEKPSRYERECKEVHNEIKDLYESYRYIVGFFLGLFDLSEHRLLKRAGLYFSKSYATADGICQFDKRRLNKRNNSVPLATRLRDNFPTLHYFFVDILFKFIRKVRNATGHRIPDTRQQKVKKKLYQVELGRFKKDFTLEELETTVFSLYFIFKLIFAEILTNLPTEFMAQVLVKLPVQEINNPLLEEDDFN